ncbi:MAG: LOG family protein [Anaerolineales bacterium]
MFVSVFGGSQPVEGDPAYAQAYALGYGLARQGHTVLTGGYIGTMEAVSRGAAEAGGHVIGVTCAEIERWRPVGPNRWVKEEWRCETLIERLQRIIRASQAWIALPGGPGTLTEIALTWNLMIIGSIPTRPLILIGDGWRRLFEQMFNDLGTYTPLSQRSLLRFAADEQAALEILAHEIPS